LSSRLIKGSERTDGVVDFRDVMVELDMSSAAGELARSDPLVRELKSRAVAEARAEGFEVGYRDGLAQAREELEETKRNLRSAVEQVISQISQTRAQVISNCRDEVGDLVLDVARKILKDEVKWNRDAVMGVVKDAMRRVIDKESVRIRVNVEDLPAVRDARADILSTVDGIRNLEIVDDRRVGLGGAIVETNSGTIDARVETQLEEIRRAFSER
jgi:flagellar assembly protein FliH